MDRAPHLSRGDRDPSRRSSISQKVQQIGATFCASMKAKISIQCAGLVRGSLALYKRCRRKQ